MGHSRPCGVAWVRLGRWGKRLLLAWVSSTIGIAAILAGMGKVRRAVRWTAIAGGFVVIALYVAVRLLNQAEPFSVGPDDPPPGVERGWSPDVLALLVSADLADDHALPSGSEREAGWRLVGPATLHFAGGGRYEAPADTPVWGPCPTLDGGSERARPRHCVMHLGLATDGVTIRWIKVIGESRADEDGVAVVPASVVTLINFDRVDEDAGFMYGRGGDVYRLSENWAWSDERRPGSGHPVFTTFDRSTGLVTRLEPASFEG